jgi:hypothetical protein
VFSLPFLGSLASFASASGRFPLGLPRLCRRHRFKFPFQLGKLLRTLSQASFKPMDLFPESLNLHNEINSCSRSFALSMEANILSAQNEVSDLEATFAAPDFIRNRAPPQEPRNLASGRGRH